MKNSTCFPVVCIERGERGSAHVTRPQTTERHEFENRAEGGAQMRFENGMLTVSLIDDLAAYRADRDPRTVLDLTVAYARMTQFSEDYLVFEGVETVYGQTTGYPIRVTLASSDSGY